MSNWLIECNWWYVLEKEMERIKPFDQSSDQVILQAVHFKTSDNLKIGEQIDRRKLSARAQIMYSQKQT